MVKNRIKKGYSLTQDEIMQLVEESLDKAFENSTDIEWKKRFEQNMRDSAPVIEELRQAGFQIKDSIEDIHKFRINHPIYKRAVPILLHWLPQISNLYVKEAIVGMLKNKNARPDATKLLIEEFLNAHKYQNQRNPWESYKWSVGDALSFVADDSVFDEIAALIQDQRHGNSRVMLATALTNMKIKAPQAVDILIDLLNKNDMKWIPLQALRKMKAEKAYGHAQRLLTHPDKDMRNEAKKFIEKIDKERQKNPGALN